MGRYSNIKTKISSGGTRLYRTNRYPEIRRSDQDLYVITTSGDRYDVLADQYYKDSSLWWVISSANYGTDQSSYYPPQGAQIRIPANVAGILKNYQKINE